jgi:hypothetical protein
MTLAAPLADHRLLFGTAHVAINLGACRGGKLHGEMPDAARRTIDQHLATQQQPALSQRMQRCQAGNRKCRRPRIGDGIRQRSDGVARRSDALSPGASRQHADDARAELWAAAIGCGLFDDAGKVPAGTRTGIRLRQRTIDLATVQRDRGDAYRYIAGRRRWQLDRLQGQLFTAGRINDDGAHCLSHNVLPLLRPLSVSFEPGLPALPPRLVRFLLVLRHLQHGEAIQIAQHRIRQRHVDPTVQRFLGEPRRQWWQ